MIAIVQKLTTAIQRTFNQSVAYLTSIIITSLQIKELRKHNTLIKETLPKLMLTTFLILDRIRNKEKITQMIYLVFHLISSSKRIILVISLNLSLIQAHSNRLLATMDSNSILIHQIIKAKLISQSHLTSIHMEENLSQNKKHSKMFLR